MTVTFSGREGKTKLSLHQAVFESEARRDEHRGGWTEGLERLGAYMAKLRNS